MVSVKAIKGFPIFHKKYFPALFFNELKKLLCLFQFGAFHSKTKRPKTANQTPSQSDFKFLHVVFPCGSIS